MKIKLRLLKLGLCIGLIACNSMIFAQVSLEWWRTYDYGNDYAHKGFISPSGDIIVTGRTHDRYRIIDYDQDGNIVHDFFSGLFWGETSSHSAMSDSGIVYMTGYRYAPWPEYNYAYTIKYNPATNNFNWHQTIFATSEGRGVYADNSGNVYVTGIMNYKMFTVKYSPAGVAQWIKNFYENSIGLFVEADDEGNVYAVGEIGFTDTYNYLIQKFNASGDSLWTRYYDYGNADEPVALKIDHAGNIVVTGSSMGTGGFYGTREDYTTVKYSPEGELLWSQRFNSTYNFQDIPKGMAIDAEDNIYITGQALGMYGTIKYSAGGDLLWAKYWQRPSANGYALAIALDEDANVYVTGTSNYDLEVLKYNKNGIMKWDTIFTRPDSQGNVPTSIVVDSDKDVFITGYANSTTGSWSDWITLKYSQIEQLVDLKVFLEGPFDDTDMNTDLNNSGMLPLTQPYNCSPWNYGGNESVSAIPNPDIVDWVLIEFRDAEDAASALPSTTIARKACFMLKDGAVVDLDGSSPIDLSLIVNDNLFIVINHRNHLAVMSSGPLVLTDGTYTWDFTSQLSNAYLDGQKEIGSGIFGMTGGDADGNGTVETNDIAGWNSNAGKQGYETSDLNLNSQVNNPDKDDIWMPNIGAASTVPDTSNTCSGMPCP